MDSLPDPIRILLVEDDAVHGIHIAEAIREIPRAEVSRWIRRASELRDLMADATFEPPHLIVQDLGLPDASGVALVREALDRWPDTKVLVVSVLSDERSVVDAIRRGASGYVLKDGDRAAISASIAEVLEGRHPISPAIARYLMAIVTSSKEEPRPNPDGPELTRREGEILERIAEGMSYAECGQSLEISRSTVESHIRTLYRKLQAHSKTQALAEARRRGLL